MPYAEDPQGKKGKRKLWSFPYVAAIAAVVCTVLLCAGGCYLLGRLGSQLDPNYTRPEEVAAHEAALRAGGPAERDAQRVEAALARAADSAVAAYPGLSWRWGDEAPGDSTCDPYNMFHQVKPLQMVLRHVLFDGELTDKAREGVVAALKTQAEGLGIAGEEGFADSYGRAWTTFSRGADSASLRLVSGRATVGEPDDLIAKEHAAAVVEGRSACLFPQRYFTENHLPVPTE
ncbi:LppA family lipoprotein [Segniliparus rugosus]|uniref:Uncharacterized protein n=1 Tax=Segniliparus rugosus (strain ATCC BAA-974 / DSM 45345 / CCUG 50838 / CIP 108380 / JCM 13579 / CDC 945) TaxID=679197 RepID=E5XPV4_SEGRC|nr:LppA family lipoprotein [Segniliparus rugosus]EFV13641.1 hypothetical protein HMPREF9336_01526 [Segniliparus rugosus ATCC BAA-974]